MTRLAELRALLAKATPGPWYRGGIDDDCVLADALATDKEEGHVVCYAYKRSNRDADADFVVAMRNALPALLDVAEAVSRGEAINSFGDCWYCGARQPKKGALNEHAEDCTWRLARELSTGTDVHGDE